MANRFIKPGSSSGKKQGNSKHKGKVHNKVSLPKELVRLMVTNLSHDGRGIAEAQGKKGFIRGALPGEVVDVRITHQQARYWEGVVSEVIEPSPHRVAPFCQHFERCGGCDLQYLDYQEQVTAKQQAVLDRLQRLAGETVSIERVEPALSAADQGYRLRARVSIGKWKKHLPGAVGFRSVGSQDVVDIDSCPVMTPALNDLYQHIRVVLPQLQQGRFITHLWLVEGCSGESGIGQNQAIAVLRYTGSKVLPQTDIETLKSAIEPLTPGTEIYLQSGKSSQLQSLVGDEADPRLTYELLVEGQVGDRSLAVHFNPLDFIQSNRAVNQSMVTQALAWLELQGNENLLDLFCGVGNFTLPLSLQCHSVIGVEGSNEMAERAKGNAKANHIANAQFRAADLSGDFVLSLLKTEEIDAILLDPPRSGAEAVAKAILNQYKASSEKKGLEKKAQAHRLPGRILYVSCDAATFARDAGILQQAGYRLAKLGVMDMFPHTAHIETMGLFLRGH
ncbi:MAG: 23S rRNA (uracil(1939)-C(5))-methyltransferase RlmD [Cellvibrionaceae bacterium]